MGQKTFLDANLNCNGIAIRLVKGNLLGNLAPKNARSAFQLVVNQFKLLIGSISGIGFRTS
ncbi:hypothetical protein C5167_030831 [Papaver somniferum]|nr:hypothetical protein C5167_030831 [Papaver somniferum]